MDLIPAEFEAFDERIAAVSGDKHVERLYRGTRWAEGPVYFPAGRFLVWSDIPNDRLLRWDEQTGAVAPFRQPSGYVNGNTLDREGRLISCEHGARRVTRTEHDGSITTLADRWQGERLNSPNDVVVRSDGSIWFTDPPYGITSDYEGHRAEQEIDGCHVYRDRPAHRRDEPGRRRLRRPNGLAFSLDERSLLRRRHRGAPHPGLRRARRRHAGGRPGVRRAQRRGQLRRPAPGRRGPGVGRGRLRRCTATTRTGRSSAG